MCISYEIYIQTDYPEDRKAGNRMKNKRGYTTQSILEPVVEEKGQSLIIVIN